MGSTHRCHGLNRVERILSTQTLTRMVIQFLFLEPNASDPLNKEAATDLRNNRDGFKRNVRTSMGGGMVKAETYERVLK